MTGASPDANENQRTTKANVACPPGDRVAGAEATSCRAQQRVVQGGSSNRHGFFRVCWRSTEATRDTTVAC